MGVVGDNEDWVMVHQVSNEPEARSLEVPGLNPYTNYRYHFGSIVRLGSYLMNIRTKPQFLKIGLNFMHCPSIHVECIRFDVKLAHGTKT